jgi:hypothetical protein
MLRMMLIDMSCMAFCISLIIWISLLEHVAFASGVSSSASSLVDLLGVDLADLV